MRTVGALALIAAAIAVFAALGASQALASSASPAPTTSAASSDPPTSPHLPTPIQHVFLILMENEQTSVIYGHQPYQTGLANTYAWGGDANRGSHTGYYATCHPSAPNYLALTSGQPLQCNSDGYTTYPVNNLGNELDQANESWVAYSESATVPCQTTTAGLYAVKHNPFPYYSDLGPGVPGSACATHDLPIANLTQDYPFAATPPAFTYIDPNLLNDAHSSSAAVGDLFLSEFVPNLIAQPYFSSSVIFIVYDEAYTEHGNENFTGYDGLWGGPVYMVAVSPYTVGMGELHLNETHYDLLSTIEWLLGLPGTGSGADMTTQFPAMTGLFQHSLFGPGAVMPSTDLPGVPLAHYDLAGDNLQFADLAGANLSHADLAGADLAWANLAGANLSGADLRGANLVSANLQGANLRAAHLEGAELTYADLYRAVLTGLGPTQLTSFNGAGLFQADLQDAQCGTPNYIVAKGVATGGILMVPASCQPPL